MKARHLSYLLTALVLPGLTNLKAHDVGHAHHDHDAPAAEPLRFQAEGQAPKGLTQPATGEGRWTFVAVKEVLPVPETAQPKVPGAHGTLVVDTQRDNVYWGLENVGWVAFADQLKRSWIVDGDPALSEGNLHGADLLVRDGKLPLVIVADNVQGEVYLSDTDFKDVKKVGWPGKAPYEQAGQFHPTDAAFVGPESAYVTDGYGAAFFMPLTIEPFAYHGEAFGGKSMSQTPHGITWDSKSFSLVVSARPEGQLKRWSEHDGFTQVMGLPPGSTVCDIDIRGDYALAPCLDGPDRAPGPIYIVNLRTKTVVSTLHPKKDLGFDLAQHIHDACWYEANGELYVLFTNWNPGGIGAMKLVR